MKTLNKKKNQKGYIGIFFIMITSGIVIFLISLLSMVGYSFSQKLQLDQITEIALETAVNEYLQIFRKELRTKTALEIRMQLKKGKLKPICTKNTTIKQKLKDCIENKLENCVCLQEKNNKCQIKLKDCWQEKNPQAPPNIVKKRYKDDILDLCRKEAEKAVLIIVQKNFSESDKINIQDFEINDDSGIMRLSLKKTIEFNFFKLDIIKKELSSNKTIKFSIQ